MHQLIIKDGIAVYVDAVLKETGTFSNGRFDPTTRTDNATVITVAQLPDFFEIGQFNWDGEKLIPKLEYEADIIDAIAKKKIAEIDADTSKNIQSGFDCAVNGTSYHFSYDIFDQQNFSDSANVANLIRSGVEGLPQSTPWNAYKNWTPESGGELVQLVFTADSFIQLYTAGALVYKQSCMAAGAARKKAVRDAVARGATISEIQAL